MTRQPNNHNPLQYSCRRILWTEESGRLQSMGSQRTRHNTVTEQQQQQHYKKMDQIWSLDLERRIEEPNLQVCILLKISMTCFSPPNPHFFTLIMTAWPNSIFPSHLSHWNSTWFGNPVLSSSPLPNAEWSCDWGRGRTKLSLSLFWAQAPLTVRSRKGKEEKHMSILCAGENSWQKQLEKTADPLGHWAPLVMELHLQQEALHHAWDDILKSQTFLSSAVHFSVIQLLDLCRTGTLLAFSVLISLSKWHLSLVSFTFSQH